MNLTGWIDGSQKPIHVGVYERAACGCTVTRYAYWDGEYWHMNSDSVRVAAMQNLRSAYQMLDWRGLQGCYTPDSEFALAA